MTDRKKVFSCLWDSFKQQLQKELWWRHRKQKATSLKIRGCVDNCPENKNTRVWNIQQKQVSNIRNKNKYATLLKKQMVLRGLSWHLSYTISIEIMKTFCEHLTYGSSSFSTFTVHSFQHALKGLILVLSSTLLFIPLLISTSLKWIIIIE